VSQRSTKRKNIENNILIARENPTPSSRFREVQRILTPIPLLSIIPLRNTEIHLNEDSHIPTSLRHRENIGRIGSLKVFWQISVKSYISPENGGFDVPWVRFPKHILHYPDWYLWVFAIPVIGIRGWSLKTLEYPSV